MNDKDEPPDAIDWGMEDSYEPSAKERALDIYKELSNYEELLYELNVLLRKDKLKEIQNGQKKEIE